MNFSLEKKSSVKETSKKFEMKVDSISNLILIIFRMYGIIYLIV